MPVGAVIPAISALLENVLERERSANGPDAILGTASAIEQDFKAGLLEAWKIACQDLLHGVAVV